MRIWFLARQSLPFDPAQIDHQRVGGSEIALAQVARGLAALGHDVVVLNHCGVAAGRYDGVRYLDLRRDQAQWTALAGAHSPDVLVLFRRMLDVATALPAKVRVFWAHDYQGVPVRVRRAALTRGLAIGWRRLSGPLFWRRVDRIFVVSEFMATVFRWLFRTPAEKLVVMPNGIDSSQFRDLAPSRAPFRFIHTSVPGRGLGQLLREIFPAIRVVHPQAELHVASYQPLDAYRALRSEGVVFRGRLSRRDLPTALAESTLMLYPSNFEEMGAMAVLEAMAAGTPAVTSDLGVLPELAGRGARGVTVPGWPSTPEFARSFVGATLALLQDSTRLAWMRDAARRYVLEHHDWQGIVRRWERVLGAL